MRDYNGYDEQEPDKLYHEIRNRLDMNRRDFLKALGGGILVVLTVRGASALQGPGEGRRIDGGEALGEIAAWLHIDTKGLVTVYTGKVELGQNIRTSLAQVAAEELRVPLASVRLVMGDTGLAPYDMGTFGSLTTPTMAPCIRRAAAAARELLIDLAARRWRADRSGLAASEGKVSDPLASSARSATYGQLTRGRKLVETVSEDVPQTPASRWSIEGQSVPKVTGRNIVTGKHNYPSDIERPGMLYGKVLRPPAFKASLKSLDAREAEAMPGVTVVRDSNFVGVAAPGEWAASRALEALRAEWSLTPQPSEGELFDYLKRNAAQDSRGDPARTQGSIEEGMAAADRQMAQTYTVAYIAHAPLEPRAAVAEWKDGKLTVWTGTQRPFSVRSEIMQAFDLPEDRVRVLMPDMGSGYGGKHTGDAAIEAARLSKASGRPVRVVWTREEEFTWAYFRPAGIIEVASGLRQDGTVTAWEFHNYNSGPAAIGTPYAIPHQKIRFHPVDSPLRQGSYRALAATANNFARETHMDEMAQIVGMDPLEFRLKNLRDARLRAVLEAAAGRFGWGKSRPSPGQGFGIACAFEKGGYVATCAEAAVEGPEGRAKAIRIVTAFECGAVLNPNHLANQIEGATVMGLGGALFEAIRFENGKILNAALSRYRIPRFSDTPAIETILLDRRDLPSAGGGETPMIALAPALGNAIFQAAGVRRRSLPLNGPGRL